MHLHEFESQFDTVILQRGKTYYQNGHISSLEQTDTGWTAIVEGNNDYVVTLHLAGNGKIITSHCNCPMKANCKHLVAVFYALLDKQSNPITPPQPEDIISVTRHKLEPVVRHAEGAIYLDSTAVKRYFTLADEIMQHANQYAADGDKVNAVLLCKLLLEKLPQLQPCMYKLDKDILAVKNKATMMLDFYATLI